MRQLKALCLVVFAVLAVTAVTAASASASLPTVLLLPGEASAAFKGTVEGAEVAQFNSALVSLQAGFVLATFTVAEGMASLGPLAILFEGVGIKGGTAKCNTSGDAAGTVLIDNAEYHLVLTTAGEAGALVLVPEFAMSCSNGLKIKIRGSVLTKVSPFGSEVQTISNEALCGGTGNRTPTWSEYSTDTGTGTAKLEANGGLGWQAACELITSAISLSTSSMGGEIMEP